jgi:hypothetical protein
MMIAAFVLLGLFATVISTVYFATGWRVFEKAGKPGWAWIVPIYNAVVLLQICGKPMWWLVFFFVPCINVAAIVFVILLTIELGKRFDKSGGFIAGLILLSPIFFPLLAFGSSQYREPQMA